MFPCFFVLVTRHELHEVSELFRTKRYLQLDNRLIREIVSFRKSDVNRSIWN